jgi:hypothetical protein
VPQIPALATASHKPEVRRQAAKDPDDHSGCLVGCAEKRLEQNRMKDKIRPLANP